MTIRFVGDGLNAALFGFGLSHKEPDANNQDYKTNRCAG